MILAVAVALAAPHAARPAAGAPSLFDSLAAGWSAAAEESRWRSPTEVRRAASIVASQSLFRALKDGCSDRALRRAEVALAAAGWRSDRLSLGDGPLILTVHDTLGGGYFAWRCGPAADVVVQAPHSFFDLDTAEIVRAMFTEVGVRGAMWNTIHRYRATPDERPEDALHPADVAHQPASLFQTWTLSAADAWPGLRVVQVHGFAGSEVVADVVLSSGVEDAAPVALGGRLDGQLGPLDDGAAATVAVFGVDTDLLGATTNAQARALVGGAGETFLHVELSRELRTWLRAGSDRPGAFLRIVMEGAWR